MLSNLATASVSYGVQGIKCATILVDVDESIRATGHQQVVVLEVNQRIDFNALRCSSVLLNFVEFVIIFLNWPAVHVLRRRNYLSGIKVPALDGGVKRSRKDLLLRE